MLKMSLSFSIYNVKLIYIYRLAFGCYFNLLISVNVFKIIFVKLTFEGCMAMSMVKSANKEVYNVRVLDSNQVSFYPLLFRLMGAQNLRNLYP